MNENMEPKLNIILTNNNLTDLWLVSTSTTKTIKINYTYNEQIELWFICW